jgi:hypothetical protein
MTTYEIKILVARGEEHRVPNTPEEQRILREIKAQSKVQSKERYGPLNCSSDRYTDVG